MYAKINLKTWYFHLLSSLFVSLLHPASNILIRASLYQTLKFFNHFCWPHCRSKPSLSACLLLNSMHMFTCTKTLFHPFTGQGSSRLLHHTPVLPRSPSRFLLPNSRLLPLAPVQLSPSLHRARVRVGRRRCIKIRKFGWGDKRAPWWSGLSVACQCPLPHPSRADHSNTLPCTSFHHPCPEGVSPTLSPVLYSPTRLLQAFPTPVPNKKLQRKTAKPLSSQPK